MAACGFAPVQVYLDKSLVRKSIGANQRLHGDLFVHMAFSHHYVVISHTVGPKLGTAVQSLCINH